MTDAMPAGIREIALCIRARVRLFLMTNVPETGLLDVQIPVLLKSCPDGHIRRLLFETHLLAAHPAKHGVQMAVRRNSTVGRDRIHAELVKATNSGSWS